jgi:hypothetical protein
VQALLPPGVNSAFDYRMDPCRRGQHSAAILAELGCAEQVAALQPARRPEHGHQRIARGDRHESRPK